MAASFSCRDSPLASCPHHRLPLDDYLRTKVMTEFATISDENSSKARWLMVFGQ